MLIAWIVFYCNDWHILSGFVHPVTVQWIKMNREGLPCYNMYRKELRWYGIPVNFDVQKVHYDQNTFMDLDFFQFYKFDQKKF